MSRVQMAMWDMALACIVFSFASWYHGHHARSLLLASMPHHLAIVERRVSTRSNDNRHASLWPEPISLNFSDFVARTIWRRRGVSPRRCRAHRLQRRDCFEASHAHRPHLYAQWG